jgi:serine/threonine protein kinase
MLINGRYQTAELLGNGPFGQTWAAHDLQGGAEVVVKQVSIRGMPGWKPLELFEREVAVLRSLDHPGVPRFIDAFQATLADSGPALILVVERVPGDTLLAMLQRGHRWSEARARQVLQALLETLDHLHGLSPPVIHRDIKPGNIVIRPDGQPVLVDFGAVHDLGIRADHHSLTVVGTAGYLSPEQAMGTAVAASDLFALGATMIHALTHCHPADLPRRGLRLVFHDRVGCSAALTGVLQRMVEPNVTDRYQRAAQVLLDLRLPSRALARTTPMALADQSSRSIGLPGTPRTVSRVASARIEGLSVVEALETSAHAAPAALFGWAGVWGMGLPSTVLVGAGAVGLSILTLAAMVSHRSARRRYHDLYRSGVAVQGQVRSVKHLQVSAHHYADVRYSYRASGVTYWGEIYCSGEVASVVDERDPVLVVHDPWNPRQHIGLLV